MVNDILFQPLAFRNLVLENRLIRSSISGRIDNYDGSGAPARIAWEKRFARGGVGAIISAHVPVHVTGRILPGYAFLDHDDKKPFWEKLIREVQDLGTKFIVQLSHSGRQQDLAGVENEGRAPPSSTSQPDSFHGFPARAMDQKEIADVIAMFAQAARRAREVHADGIELHGGNGYLFTQFLSSAINDRHDGYGGDVEHRSRFYVETIRAIRKEVGNDFHIQAKLSVVDHHNAVFFWEAPGNTQAEGVEIAKLLEKAGADAIHVSTGSMFPHPLNPVGTLPFDELRHNYDTLVSSGSHTLRNFLIFKFFAPLFRPFWNRTLPESEEDFEGLNRNDSRAIKAAVKIPVLCTGGFQTASKIRDAINSGDCDAVTIARPLLANPTLPLMFREGLDRAPKPCTYCNKCLLRVIEDPLGCYEESRFEDYDAMIKDVMSFYAEQDPPYADSGES